MVASHNSGKVLRSNPWLEMNTPSMEIAGVEEMSIRCARAFSHNGP